MEKIKTIVIVILLSLICGSSMPPDSFDTYDTKFFGSEPGASYMCVNHVLYAIIAVKRAERIQAMGVTVVFQPNGLPVQCKEN